MNHFYPAQLKDGPNAGKWHYVCSNKREGTHAVGYCARGCPGHETKEEAREHYRQYQLDERLRFFSPPDGSPPRAVLYKCEAKDGCEEYTAGAAHIGAYQSFHLCDKHRNRAEVEKLFEVGDSWES